MNLAEIKSEFQTIYDSGSMGAPSLNNYEISLFLTMAARDIALEVYHNAETTEFVKRALSTLVKEKQLSVDASSDIIPELEVSEVALPADLYFILQENVRLKGVSGHIDIIPEDLDEINVTVKNPFRKPSNKRILRTEIGSNKLRLYSTSAVDKYKIKYFKKPSPIILTDMTTDPDLNGDETIEGQTKPSMTELPDFLHKDIVKRAVVYAVRSARENNLQTQIEV